MKPKPKMKTAPTQKSLPLLGWREWVALPTLDIPRIRAKVDTGARTSALDSELLEEFEENGVHKIRFLVFTGRSRKRPERTRTCTADIVESRWITNSGGGRENRVVIRTPVVIGGFCKEIEITLANRNSMKYRMLLGRTAVAGAFHVDPAHSHLAGEPRAVDSVAGVAQQREAP